MNKTAYNQWRSHPKILAGDQHLDIKPTTVFGLGHRLSKHKTTRYAGNLLGGAWLLRPPWLRPCIRLLSLILIWWCCFHVIIGLPLSHHPQAECFSPLIAAAKCYAACQWDTPQIDWTFFAVAVNW